MPNRFYKKEDVVDGKYYRIPSFAKADFSGIAARDLMIQEGDRLDILAEQLWGDSNYWRYLALFNGIGYFFDLVPGDIIRVPIDIQQVIRRV